MASTFIVIDFFLCIHGGVDGILLDIATMGYCYASHGLFFCATWCVLIWKTVQIFIAKSSSNIGYIIGWNNNVFIEHSFRAGKLFISFFMEFIVNSRSIVWTYRIRCWQSYHHGSLSFADGNRKAMKNQSFFVSLVRYIYRDNVHDVRRGSYHHKLDWYRQLTWPQNNRVTNNLVWSAT